MKNAVKFHTMDTNLVCNSRSISKEHIPCVWLVREKKANSSPLATSHLPNKVGLDLQWTLNTVL